MLRFVLPVVVVAAFAAAACSTSSSDDGSPAPITPGADGGTADGSPATCKRGETRCADDGVETCDGATWVKSACDARSFCHAGACVACDGAKGSLHDQTIEVGGETRAYFLHVPTSYACNAAAPILVDFHGTAGAKPEEAYGLDAAIALAEKEGIILVRPRSRSSKAEGQEVYRWDQNAGDESRNVELVKTLLADLEGRFHVDAKARYAFGFSSGTNMAAQFLFEKDDPFAGLAMVGGGLWSKVSSWPTFDANAPRIWDTTGYRDYLHSARVTLEQGLYAHGYPKERFFTRETMAGHDLYDWHYAEAWAWMKKGERAQDGAAGAAFVRETSLPESLTSITKTPSGDIVVTGAKGSVFHRSAGTNTFVRSTPATVALTSSCVLASGKGIAVGGGAVATTSDGGKTWATGSKVPELGMQQFGFAYLNGVACNDNDTILGAGYWNAAKSTDGASWSNVGIDAGGFGAQVAAVGFGQAGSAVAAGYYSYIARRGQAGGDFVLATVPAGHDWFLGVAAAGGTYHVVGDRGGVLVSTDDGSTWTEQATPTKDDLYGVSFFDASLGIAVGAHGTVLVTENGGTTWTLAPTGFAGYFAGATWLDDHTALLVGEGGAIFRYERT